MWEFFFPTENSFRLYSDTAELVPTPSPLLRYRLIADLPSVLNMYYDWGRQYDLAYAIAARNILRDVASNWTAYEFFYNRTEIEAKMQSQLEQRIQDNGGTLDDLQLIVIDLPGSFEAELTQTEQVRQNIEQVEFEVKDARVKAANKRKRMFDEALVVGNQMKVEARREYNRKQKELQSLDESLRAQVSAFTALQKRTNLTRQNMLNYVFLQNLHKVGRGVVCRLCPGIGRGQKSEVGYGRQGLV